MEDKDIIALYWARSEEAIRRTAEKYGAYCAQIIRRVLGDGRDAEECLSDTWLGAWNAMPPQKPARLPPFLGRIARNTALDRYDYNAAQCRSGGFEAVLEELGDCVGGVPMEEDFDFRTAAPSAAAGISAAVLVLRRRGGDRRRDGVQPIQSEIPAPPDPAGSEGASEEGGL